MLASLFNKAAGLEPCNFIKKRLQHSCFPVKFERFLEHLFYRTSPVAASYCINTVNQISFETKCIMNKYDLDPQILIKVSVSKKINTPLTKQ